MEITRNDSFPMTSPHHARSPASTVSGMTTVTGLEELVHRVGMGELAIIPGPTNYSLIANGEDSTAVDRLYLLKRRPAHKPVTLLCPPEQVDRWVEFGAWQKSALELLGQPVVVIGRARVADRLAPQVVNEAGGLGVIWFESPLHRLLTQTAAYPIVGSSLNEAGQLATLRFVDIPACFDEVGLRVDGGDCTRAGDQAAVVDFTQPRPLLRRAGAAAPSEAWLDALLRSGGQNP